MHFHYMTYKAMPQHKNPCPGAMEFNKRPMGHIAHPRNQFKCSKLLLYHDLD